MFPALFLLFGFGGGGGAKGQGGIRTSYCAHAQNTGIYRVFASLYNILRKDVEQEKLSQASMPLAEVRCQLTPKPQIEHKSK